MVKFFEGSLIYSLFLGILPADQMMDYFTPVQLLCNRVDRHVFESLYSIMLPKPAEFEDENRPATSHELLTAMAFMRGFMSAAGIPDCSRSARVVIKDVFNGKLKWMAAPPGFDQREFDKLASIELPEKNLKNSGKTLLNQVFAFYRFH
jgi:large subunit GTPase 1